LSPRWLGRWRWRLFGRTRRFYGRSGSYLP